MQDDTQNPFQPTNPTPPTPPTPPRRRSVVTPVILILLGLAFLAQNLGLIDWNFWNLLVRLWPVWLIAVGLDLLIGRRTAWGSYAVLGVVVAVVGAALWLDLPVRSGSYGVGDPVEISEPVGEAKQAEITIDASIAELKVAATASDAMVEGTVIPLSSEQIRKDARMSGDTFVFSLKSAGRNFVLPIGLGDTSAPSWDLRLSDQVPMSLVVDTGVGETRLDLTGLQLTDLKVNSGVGETEITLPAEGQFRVEVDAGVGEVTVRVPKGMAARIRADQGVGEIRVRGDFDRNGEQYTSQNYNQAQNRVDIEIDGGVGEITVEEIE